eukprot:3156876-Pyramimonas_sp.AAC.1
MSPNQEKGLYIRCSLEGARAWGSDSSAPPPPSSPRPPSASNRPGKASSLRARGLKWRSQRIHESFWLSAP